MANSTIEKQGEHREYPVADWKYEIANGDTRLGYWEWVEHLIESNKEQT